MTLQQEISPDIGQQLCSLLDSDLEKTKMHALKLQLQQEQKKEERFGSRIAFILQNREIARVQIPGLGSWLEDSKGLKTDEEVLFAFMSKLEEVGEVMLVSLYGSKYYRILDEKFILTGDTTLQFLIVTSISWPSAHIPFFMLPLFSLLALL